MDNNYKGMYYSDLINERNILLQWMLDFESGNLKGNTIELQEEYQNKLIQLSSLCVKIAEMYKKEFVWELDSYDGPLCGGLPKRDKPKSE